MDVYDLFRNSPDGDGDNSGLITRLRNELASVSHNDFQPNIWLEAASNCSSNSTDDVEVYAECAQSAITFNNLTTLRGPYVAQLPASYQTGLLTQSMPRMNSSVSFNVSQTAFPSNCETTSGAYFVEYSYNTTVLNVLVCMPDGISQSQWKATRDRQDTTETLFLKISHSGNWENLADLDANPRNMTFKLTINTTLGYFHLPNYNNKGIAGPLLAKDSKDICSLNEDKCLSQKQSKRSLQTNESSTSFAIDDTLNLGPLAMIVAAMFEPGSFIATQIPQNGTTAPAKDMPGPTPAIPCTVGPLNLLLIGLEETCYHQPSKVDDGYVSITKWLASFYDIGNMQNALHAAAILASQVWLSSVDGTLEINYDLGQDSTRPKISSAGVIVISILLAIDLFLLLVVATYIRFSYTWTDSFDSSAMMRLGAARANDLPLQVSTDEAKEKTRAMLGEMPGWVGDARPDDEVGAVAIGATVPLKAGRRYEAFLDK